MNVKLPSCRLSGMTASAAEGYFHPSSRRKPGSRGRRSRRLPWITAFADVELVAWSLVLVPPARGRTGGRDPKRALEVGMTVVAVVFFRGIAPRLKVPGSDTSGHESGMNDTPPALAVEDAASNCLGVPFAGQLLGEAGLDRGRGSTAGQIVQFAWVLRQIEQNGRVARRADIFVRTTPGS